MPSPYWLIVVIVAIFGVAILQRSRAGRPPSQREPRKPEPVWPRVPPLEPGERYDTSVKLATVANAPLADLWCQRLREEGIEAFFTGGASASLAGIYGGPVANPGYPTEIRVGAHDVERARQLFPELT